MLLQSIKGAVLNYERTDEVVGAALTAKARALLGAGRMEILSHNLQSKVHAGNDMSGRLVRRVIGVGFHTCILNRPPSHLFSSPVCLLHFKSDVVNIPVPKTIWGDKKLRAFRRRLLSDDTGLLIPDAVGGKLLLTRVHDFPDVSGKKVRA
jgi:hypothetical protein